MAEGDWYAPSRRLPRTRYGDPLPDVAVPHTQLGTRTERRGGSYRQAREWMVVGGRLTATRDIDFTDHSSPETHSSPHQHNLTPNNAATAPHGGYHRGSATPLERQP